MRNSPVPDFAACLCSQNPHLNQNAWNNLEKYSRSLAKHNKNVYVCTGPLYLPRYRGGPSWDRARKAHRAGSGKQAEGVQPPNRSPTGGTR